MYFFCFFVFIIPVALSLPRLSAILKTHSTWIWQRFKELYHQYQVQRQYNPSTLIQHLIFLDTSIRICSVGRGILQDESHALLSLPQNSQIFFTGSLSHTYGILLGYTEMQFNVPSILSVTDSCR